MVVSSFWRPIVVGAAAVSYSHFASSAFPAHGLRAGHESDRQCNRNVEHTPSRDIASKSACGCAVPRRYGRHHDEQEYNDERNDNDSEEMHTF